MSILLITGIPGSGKTLFAVSRLKKEIEKNISLPVDEQRKIYCDITGLKIENIEKPPIDWRTTPERSLLIYDEAQFHEEFKPTRGINRFKFVEDLTIHRKTGHEIWFITQDPNRLHNDILAMVEQHFHLERPYGAKLATIYQYRGAEKFAKRPSVKERAERKSLFNYDKSLYELYESSQVDDGIKMRLPRELTMWIIIAIGLGYLTFHFATGDGTQKYINAGRGNLETEKKTETKSTISENMKEAVKVETTQQVQPVLTPQQYELQRVAMVFATQDTCVAKNSYGEILFENDAECLEYANKTKRMNFSRLELKDKHSHDVNNEPIQQVSVQKM